jgi:hypothetical protein
MTKLNEYQKMIITSGLVSWARELKVEITNMEAEGALIPRLCERRLGCVHFRARNLAACCRIHGSRLAE